ncbi:MAG: type II toxin-antitoxin system RelE/ParE family toxin [Candidatus Competibacteraceae bacterium]|nr:type II toxin-antitoxin system RelE/ParE family toxin [Candidatus Competibacteraceae bacterium]
MDRFQERFLALADFPKMGMSRDIFIQAGLRSQPVGNYLIFYFPLADGIGIIRVLHGSRDVEKPLVAPLVDALSSFSALQGLGKIVLVLSDAELKTLVDGGKYVEVTGDDPSERVTRVTSKRLFTKQPATFTKSGCLPPISFLATEQTR